MTMFLEESSLARPAGWLVAAFVLALAVAATSAAAEALGPFEDHGDVGSPRLPGSAAYNGFSQDLAMSAAGVNLWGARDEFHFVWKKLAGNFLVQARVELLGKGVEAHRKLGVMVRSTLDPDSPYADGAVHGDGLTSLQFRRAKGKETEEIRSTLTGADVLQIERHGDRITLRAARFGEPFVASELDAIDLGNEVYVGLFLCSHNPDVVERAVFRDVRLTRPVKDGFQPYRDYIGSRLEVLDVETGRRTLLHASAQPFEAPNWTRDGAALIYNASGADPKWRGQLYRFDLATREARPIDSGFANRNNNDHVLSFDGRQLGISDNSQGDGESRVYTLPAGGGTPKAVTPLGPSYLHGWSPDGKFLVFTGGRNDEYDIYRIPADGSGPEARLTDVKGLDDGPEYSPDGKFIYFNSTRSGRMQIWRMKPDGSEPERVLESETNDWFPHLSPDGRWIAFVSFGQDVAPNDHPYYKHVSIRLVPAEGGQARVIAYVYGGQGTMNVPSWSPDSRHLAFVSNSGELE
jgi:TolB protein